MNTRKFTPKEIEAIRQIRNWLSHHGRTPSQRELMAAMNYKSPKSAQDIIKKLEKKGVLSKSRSGSIRLVKDPISSEIHAQTVQVPLVGIVSCGSPILAEENIESMISVSTSLAKPPHRHFILRAKGDSMNLAGINDGDFVLVKQQESANSGERVVALIDDEATIKEYYKKAGIVVLKPKSNNPKHSPIVLTEDFRIQGIVKSIIPNL